MSSSNPTTSNVLLNPKLSTLLKTRESFLEKVKEFDEQMSNVLHDGILESNVERLKLITSALAASLFNFKTTILEFYYPTQPQLIIARKDKVYIQSPESLQTTRVNPVAPPSFSSISINRKEQSVQTIPTTEFIRSAVTSVNEEN